jgi:hypothetical protein
MLSIGGDDETHLTFKTRLVPVHSAGEVRVLPPGSARFPSLVNEVEESCDDGRQEMLYASDNPAKIGLPDVWRFWRRMPPTVFSCWHRCRIWL